MSVYSYVVLKVHTNVLKVGTHLNVCLINRTYVRWKYTFMFAYNNKRSIYLYIMNIPLPRPFSTFLFPFSIILYLYTKRETLFPALTFPATFFLHLCLPLYSFIIYSIYREYFSATFLALSHTFIILLIYREWYTLWPPFLPLYKVNTFSTATFFIFLKCYLWEKFAGKSFWKLY